MTKQDVPVESATAQSLAAQASRRGKTLYALMNEILDAALRVYGEGGTAEEILVAWKTLRMSRELRAPILPRSLIGNMVQRISQLDPEWIQREWFGAGRILGDRLRSLYPAIEDVQTAPLLSGQRIEVRRISEGERIGRIQVRAATDPDPEVTACLERLIVGLVSAYAFRITDTRVTDGNIEVMATYEGRPVAPASEAARATAASADSMDP